MAATVRRAALVAQAALAALEGSLICSSMPIASLRQRSQRLPQRVGKAARADKAEQVDLAATVPTPLPVFTTPIWLDGPLSLEVPTRAAPVDLAVPVVLQASVALAVMLLCKARLSWPRR